MKVSKKITFIFYKIHVCLENVHFYASKLNVQGHIVFVVNFYICYYF